MLSYHFGNTFFLYFLFLYFFWPIIGSKYLYMCMHIYTLCILLEKCVSTQRKLRWLCIHPDGGMHGLLECRWKAGCWWMVPQRKFSRSTVCFGTSLSTWPFSCLLRSICLVLTRQRHLHILPASCSLPHFCCASFAALPRIAPCCRSHLWARLRTCTFIHLQELGSHNDLHAKNVHRKTDALLLCVELLAWAVCFRCGFDELRCPFSAGYSSDKTQATTVTVARSSRLKLELILQD